MNSKSAIARGLWKSLIGVSIACCGIATLPASAQPNVNSVAIYEVSWGPACSTFAVMSSVNEAGNEKDISNIVLACGMDEDGNVTWDKWEFDDGSPYVFGTALPGDLVPSEGSGCSGPIRTAYVKAGSGKSGKGIPGVDKKEFNGHVGGQVDCEPLGGN